MASHTAIGINDDLAAREASITHGAPGYETACWVNKKPGGVIEQVSGNDRLDDMLDHVQANLLLIYIIGMLRRDNNSIDTHWTTIFILYGDLALTIRT